MIARPGLIIVLLGVVSLFIFTGLQLFSGPTFGSDYTFFLPRLLYGFYWQVENGLLAVPWFTPAFCGGLPYYADPQVLFYSLPQAMLWILSPTQVVLATYVIFGLAAWAGCFLLLRTLGVGAWLAVTGAALFAFNEFFLFRMLIGHFTYHVFSLIPLLAWCLVRAAMTTGLRGLWWQLSAGILIAMIVHGGAMNFLLPAMLSVAALLALNILVQGRGVGRHIRVLLQAAAVGFLLSVSKIVAGYAFVSRFPREELSLGIFSSIPESAFSIFTLLFMNPWLSLNGIEADYLVQAQELRFGVTAAPLLLLALGLFAIPTLLRSLNVVRLLALVFIVVVMLIPVVLSVDSPAVNDVLKSLPYFREMSLAVRWIALLIPLVICAAVLLGQAFTRELGNGGEGAAVGLSLLSLGILVVSHLMTEKPWDHAYNPAPLVESHASVLAGGSIPSVAIVSSRPGSPTFIGVDDVLVSGSTSKVCYQPIFGYRLEKYPIRTLADGSVFKETAGRLNLKNPACYLYPEANQCRPGDHFTIAQADEAARFASSQPYVWQVPLWQQGANWLNVIALVAVAAGWLVLGAAGLRRAV